jgi:hypothetical protein
MTNRVAPDVAWVVDDVTGVVVGQRLSDGTVADPFGGGDQLTPAELAAVQDAVANGLATYAAGEIEKLAGIPNLAPLLALAELTAYPRPFTLYQQGALGTLTQPAATWTSVTASDNGSGKLRLSSAGVHGLATTGRKIYVTFATTGSGLHEIATIVNTTDLDFTTDFSAVSGAVTVYVAGTASYGINEICTIDGGTMGPNGSLDVSILAEFTANATAKYFRLYLGGSQVGEAAYSGASDAGAQMFGRIANKADDAAQACAPMKVNNTSPSYSTTVDTSADAVLSLRFQVPTADHYLTINSIRVTLTPGL